ncbi:hypothetical protein [Dickeya oryzae]
MSDQHRLTTPDYIGLHRTTPNCTALYRTTPMLYQCLHLQAPALRLYLARNGAMSGNIDIGVSH